ncbi:hypothetical protein Tco_1368568 [Tanacetum coccineum]
MLFGVCPTPPSGPRDGDSIHYLKGFSTNLFYIIIYFEDWGRRVPIRAFVFKSDMTCIDWEKRECLKYWDLTNFKYEDLDNTDVITLDMSCETWKVIDDLKNATFFVDLARDCSVSYRRVIASDAGGFIHIRGEMGETIYSYHVKTDTISLFHKPSPMLPTSHLSLWECRLKGDHGEAECIIDPKEEMENNTDELLTSRMDCGVKSNESELLNVPLCILETIMELCVGVEYMNLRATCKECHLAAPLVKWCNDTSLRRLQTYSVVSPWLMVADKKRGIMTFTDPLLGDNYFLEKPDISVVYGKLYCSKFGWLLFKSYALNCLVFFNPFTNVIKELPSPEYSLESLCFSAPPTSFDCIVVGFITVLEYWRVDILYVNREPTWRTLNLGLNPQTICFPTFYGGDFYALCKERELLVINNLDKEDYSWKLVEAEAPKGSCTSSTQYFLTNCYQHLLLVSVGEYGGHVEVFKRNETKQEWDKIDSVGKHMIFVCGTTCLCIEAKVPKMENKIFFPRLRAKNRKMDQISSGSVCDGFPALSSKYPCCLIIGVESLHFERGNVSEEVSWLDDICFPTIPNNNKMVSLDPRDFLRSYVIPSLNFGRWRFTSHIASLFYALNNDGTFAFFVIRVDIMVRDKEVVIKLMLFGTAPLPPSGPRDGDNTSYLKGVSTKLFYISIFFQDWRRRIPIRVFVFESDMACIDWEKRECLKYWDISDFKDEDEMDFKTMDMSSETWKVIDDLKNATFFVDLARDHSVSYTRVIASDAGGFIHIRGKKGETIYSYHIKTDTISLFHIPSPMLPTSHLSLWECRLKGDHGEAECIIDSKAEMEKNNDILLWSGMECDVNSDESHLLNIPVHILETIMEFCVGVEYMNLRATCKQCRLAAPSESVSIFNPFTNDIKELPRQEYEYSLQSLCFSAPPTSLDCIVVGFLKLEYWRADILYVNREPTWRTLNLGPDPHTICFPTFYGGDLYALCKEGELLVINNLDKEDYSLKLVKAEAPKGSCTSSTQYFLTNCDQHLLLVRCGRIRRTS